MFFTLKNWLKGFWTFFFFFSFNTFFFIRFWKTHNIKVLRGNVTLFCRVAGFVFMDLPGTPGSGSSPPALWFSLPSFETPPGPPAARWTPHQTAREETGVCLRAPNKHLYKQTHTQAGERHGVSREWPQGTSADTKTRRLTLSGRFLFIAPVALEPRCPLSSFQAWLSCMLMDLTFAETKPCRYDDINGPAGCLAGWWDRTLKEKTHPGPPWCPQTVVVRLLEGTFKYHT